MQDDREQRVVAARWSDKHLRDKTAEVPVGCSIKRIISDHPSTASIEGIAVSEELPTARPRRAWLS